MDLGVPCVYCGLQLTADVGYLNDHILNTGIVGDGRCAALYLLHSVGIGTHFVKGQLKGETAVGVIGHGLHGLSVLRKLDAELTGVHGPAGKADLTTDGDFRRCGNVGVGELDLAGFHRGLQLAVHIGDYNVDIEGSTVIGYAGCCALVLTENDMKTWNMVNMPMRYIGNLTERTKGKGVTTKSSLYFKDSIPLYGVIDGYAYFPSGQNIYKIAVDKFENIEAIGPKCQTLAAYRTVYYSSGSGRKHNIELVSSVIDGTVIPEGQSFSYNRTTGPRTAKNGYQLATVIESGQYVEGYGGGVCQVSSTIYAAIMNDPNINVISRRKHGLDVSYIPYGMDATVSYGSIDLLFSNEYPFDIKLNIYAMDGVCMVTFTRVN